MATLAPKWKWWPKICRSTSLSFASVGNGAAPTDYLSRNVNTNTGNASVLSTGTLTMTGATPTISVGSSNNLATPGFIYENITSANNLLVENETTLGERIAVNFNGVNSFAGGITIDSPNTDANWDSTGGTAGASNNQSNGNPL